MDAFSKDPPQLIGMHHSSYYCKVALKMHLPRDAFLLIWSWQIFKSQHLYLQQPLHPFSGSRALIYGAHYHIVSGRNQPFHTPNKVNKMAFSTWHRNQTTLTEKSQVPTAHQNGKDPWLGQEARSAMVQGYLYHERRNWGQDSEAD